MTVTLNTLVSFNGTDGRGPAGGLIANNSGDLFGTTSTGGAFGFGTVFELVKHGGSYTPTTLFSFDGTDGSGPVGSLIADSKGNLFGVTSQGGANNDGTVFEIAKHGSHYDSSLTTLVSFDIAATHPTANLIMDADGNLFGTTFDGGQFNQGTVFEILNTGSGYASTPTILVNFMGGTDGENPRGLIMDANGNLFGTTSPGPFSPFGTVFEIAKTPSGYDGTPTTLFSFDGTDGAVPVGSLIADHITDHNGDLFGTTFLGGASNDGTVFQINGAGFFV